MRTGAVLYPSNNSWPGLLQWTPTPKTRRQEDHVGSITKTMKQPRLKLVYRGYADERGQLTFKQFVAMVPARPNAPHSRQVRDIRIAQGVGTNEEAIQATAVEVFSASNLDLETGFAPEVYLDFDDLNSSPSGCVCKCLFKRRL